MDIYYTLATATDDWLRATAVLIHLPPFLILPYPHSVFSVFEGTAERDMI